MASSIVNRGLLCCRSCSSSVIAGAVRDTVNASAANCDWIMSVTLAFRPWTSDTTAMIDVTATMLPSTVSSDRSLFAQIACSAMLAAS